MIAAARSASPLRGRYLVTNPGWNLWLRVADRLAAALPARRGRAQGPPRRILIAVGGHLGDAVIATSVLPVIRAALPGADIGVLAPTWSGVVFSGHPDVRRIHSADHWKTSRDRRPLVQRWWTYRTGAARAVREIAEASYDLAVDLYPYYPNVAPLLWRAAVPERVGFESGGYGPLFTRAVPWRDGGRHAAERHLELLAAAGIGADSREPVYDLPPLPEEARSRVVAVLAEAGVIREEYVVLHMGAGSPLKEWPSRDWRAVATALSARGIRTVFTGAGSGDARLVEKVQPFVQGGVDLCGRLSWDEFRAVLQQARLVVSVDTVAAHVAAAEGTPGVVLMASVSDPAHWRPLGGRTTVLGDTVPWTDGARRSGAPRAMTGVTPHAVLALVEQRLMETRRER